jgi:hypothetical protein
MSSTTPNLGLTKPAGAEAADVAIINANMDTIDTAVAAKAPSTAPTLTNPVLNGTVTGTGVGTAASTVAAGDHTHAFTGTGSTFLGADVVLNNTGTWFSGPNTGSIGANGQKWLILATATMLDTAGVARLHARITDGSGVQAESAAVSVAASDEVVVSLSVVVTLSGATTFTLAARDSTSTSGKLLTTETASGASNLASSITAVRLS